jgi:hypothetical protein
MAYHHLLQQSPTSRLFEQAREELLSHLLRSGISAAPVKDQRDWVAETLTYLANRYPALQSASLDDLRGLAERYTRRAESGG